MSKIPLLFVGLLLWSMLGCKKNKVTTDPNAKVQFSQDSVLFDTVFTSIGSSTQHIMVRNKNSQKIKISSIQLMGGPASAFKINVDGSPGTSFSDIEIAAKDSMYIFIQVNVNPGNINSPFIIQDSLQFNVNGNLQKVQLEAWGQNAYYHRPQSAIYFSDGTFLSYSICDSVKDAVTYNGTEIIWKNDKPHVVYGYCVVDSTQKLTIPAGTRVYMNYRAAIWVYRYGEIHIQGQKGNEVIFQGARREKELADDPGQWDRIWINEGSNNNTIDYAIIKNGYVGVQAELFGNSFFVPKHLKITNTKIQNMSKWGLYGSGYNIYAGNNVVSNCQEQSLNLALGGSYTFLNCTFSNFWAKDNARQNPTINITNYTDLQTLPLDSAYFGNCIVDGTLDNEIKLDLKSSSTTSLNPHYWFSNCWMKTTNNTSDANIYINCKKDNTSLKYKDPAKYDFSLDASESRNKGFNHPKATADASQFPQDINGTARDLINVAAGAYQN